MRAYIALTVVALLAGAARADVYVNNVDGSDANDGRSAKAEGGSGPVKTLKRATEILKESERLILAKTTSPYREGLVLSGLGGRPGAPMVIEGNGAALEGLRATKADEWQDEGDGLFSIEWKPEWGFDVILHGRPVPRAASREEIKPNQTILDKTAQRGYYRLPPGEKMGNDVEIPSGYSGVTILDSSHIVIRDLECRYFWNDGFNIHGDSQGLYLERVTGAHNGDEGISAHGTSDVMVVASEFHDNDNGIADTVTSRTRYYGVKVYDNRAVGVWFQGGDHSLVDVELRGNPAAIQMEQGQGPTYLPGFTVMPDVVCRVYMKNVHVRDGSVGVYLAHESKLTADHVTLVGQPIGIKLEGGSTYVHMTNSIVAPTETAIIGTGTYWGDYNCWGIDKAVIAGNEVGLEAWLTEQKLDGHSVFGDPRLARSVGPELEEESPAIGKAYLNEEEIKWIKHSGMWNEAHPPKINADMGARFVE